MRSRQRELAFVVHLDSERCELESVDSVTIGAVLDYVVHGEVAVVEVFVTIGA